MEKKQLGKLTFFLDIPIFLKLRNIRKRDELETLDLAIKRAYGCLYTAIKYRDQGLDLYILPQETEQSETQKKEGIQFILPKFKFLAFIKDFLKMIAVFLDNKERVKVEFGITSEIYWKLKKMKTKTGSVSYKNLTILAISFLDALYTFKDQGSNIYFLSFDDESKSGHEFFPDEDWSD